MTEQLIDAKNLLKDLTNTTIGKKWYEFTPYKGGEIISTKQISRRILKGLAYSILNQETYIFQKMSTKLHVSVEKRPGQRGYVGMYYLISIMWTNLTGLKQKHVKMSVKEFNGLKKFLNPEIEKLRKQQAQEDQEREEEVAV